MSGAATLLLLLLCAQVFAYDWIEPPTDLNVTVIAFGKILLTWKPISSPQNKSVTYHVKIQSPELKDDLNFKIHNNFFTRYLALHSGLSVHVATVLDNKWSTWVNESLPPFSGTNETSAKNLSCWIELETSGECIVRCSWAPGDKAPADTQYHLFYRYGEVIESCQNYVTEAEGRRWSCHVLSRNIYADDPKPLLVHINGTSKSAKIKAMEEQFLSINIDEIPTVQNLTLEGNDLKWIKPVYTLSEYCFKYNLHIWSKGRNENITVSHPSYSISVLKNPSYRHFIRVRAVGQLPCWDREVYSSWSDIILIGEDKMSDTDWSRVLGVILFICLLVVFIVLFVLCIRFWGHLFPHIPRPKDDLKECFQNIQSQALTRCNSWDNEEVISYIEELIESEKYKTSSDYGHIADHSSSRSGHPHPGPGRTLPA
ncbi:interleukin-5 receptor subunit alpha [Leptodactylus fuscus]|uniref:interleukin-5 receptor subunit alpha n=1 Tax=Leptodactylus fuscus TaxID=238119 RepID=UPI003F4EAFE4